MRRRLYYLLPDLPSARKIMDDLLLARIEERHIHFLAKRGTPMDGLHEANILQKSDLVHGAQRGVLIGAAHDSPCQRLRRDLRRLDFEHGRRGGPQFAPETVRR